LSRLFFRKKDQKTPSMGRKALDILSNSGSLDTGAITSNANGGLQSGPIIQNGNYAAQRGRAGFDIRQQFSADGT
jgi:hypothetical protein